MVGTGRRRLETTSAAPSRAELNTIALYEEYGERVYRLCLRRLGSREDAADAAQETFVNAWQALERGDEITNPLPWLLRIADNECVNRFRARRSRVIETELVDQTAEDPGQPTEMLVDLTEALRSLPTRQRRAFLRRELQGFSYDEISADLGVSLAAATSLVHRARTAVARSLDRARRQAPTLLPLPQFLRPLFESPATVGAAATTTVILALPIFGSGPAPHPSPRPSPATQLPGRGHGDGASERSVRRVTTASRGALLSGTNVPIAPPKETVAATPGSGDGPAHHPPPESNAAPDSSAGISVEPAQPALSPPSQPERSAPDQVEAPASNIPAEGDDPRPAHPAHADPLPGTGAADSDTSHAATKVNYAPEQSEGSAPAVVPGSSGNGPSQQGGSKANDPPKEPGSNGNGQPEDPGANGNGPPHEPGSGGNGPPEEPGSKSNGPAQEPGSKGNGPPQEAGSKGNGPPQEPGSTGNGPPPEHAGPQGNGPPTDPGPQGNGPPADPGSEGNGPPAYLASEGTAPPEDPGSRGNGPGENSSAEGNDPPQQPGSNENGPPQEPDTNGNGPPADPGSQGNDPPEHAGGTPASGRQQNH